MNQEHILNRTARQPKIVGGSLAQPIQFPYHVSLQYDNQYFCGGSIVNALLILTAAHCMKNKNANRMNVTAGQIDRYQNSGLQQIRRAKQIYIHESYNQSSFQNDIAMILLESPLLFNVAVNNITLPDKKENFQGFTTVCGWGSQYEGDGTTNLLRHVSVPLIDNVQCKREYKKVNMIVTNNMLCAGEHYKDSCQGDSGGAAICKRNTSSNSILCGIVSAGYGCARKSFPGVYTKVSEYTDWIENIREISHSLKQRFLTIPGKCTTDRFHCGSHCIPRTFVCDQKSDCPYFEDELECIQKTNCELNEFRCNNGKCITQDQICNQVDECGDGSDEEKCNKNCNQGLFQCGNGGRCIPQNWRCDNIQDCEDNSDEKYCNWCTNDEFYCSTENKCIHKQLLCNQNIDCKDGVDEEGCTYTIYNDMEVNNNCSNQFICQNGRCIPHNWKCDGWDDCFDASDELNCNFPECDRYQFRCTHGKCIYYRFQCNGYANCFDNSDEVNCPSRQ